MSDETSTSPVIRWGMSGLALIPVALCGLVGSVSHDSPALNRTETSPRTLQFATYCIHYGTEPIKPKQELINVFRFRNTGNSDISIGDIDRSCGCLLPVVSPRQLKPGESGIMNVAIPLAEQGAGFQEYRLTVHYDDGSDHSKQETLLIKAVLPEPTILVTPRAMLVSQKTSIPITHEFTVFDSRLTPLTIQSLQPSVEWVRATVDPQADHPTESIVRVEIGGDIPAGRHRVLVSAQTNDVGFPVVTLPMLIEGPPRPLPVIVEPTTLRMLAAEKDTRPMRVTVPQEWDVSHVNCSLPQMRVEWKSSDLTTESDRQVVELSLKLTEAPPAGLRECVVTLHANSSEEICTMRVEIVR